MLIIYQRHHAQRIKNIKYIYVMKQWQDEILFAGQFSNPYTTTFIATYKFSFLNISNTYRVVSNYFRLR